MFKTETKGDQKRTTTTKQNTNDSSYLVKEVTPQIVSLDTKPFVIFTDALFKVDRIFKRWFNRFALCSGMKIEFLLSTGIK